MTHRTRASLFSDEQLRDAVAAAIRTAHHAPAAVESSWLFALTEETAQRESARVCADPACAPVLRGRRAPSAG